MFKDDFRGDLGDRNPVDNPCISSFKVNFNIARKKVLEATANVVAGPFYAFIFG